MPILPRKDIQSIDWLSNDITVQLVKVLLGDALCNLWEGLLHSVDCDDKWKHYLTSLRHYLWPEVPCNNTSMNNHTRQMGQSTTSFDELHQTERQKTLMQGQLGEI